MTQTDWKIFKNDGGIHSNWWDDFPEPPSWRRFDDQIDERKKKFVAPENAIEVVNAALYLRRPLLVTGNPGTGKSSLAYAVASELGLGEVLKWPITTRTTLQDGLYRYDAIARLRDSQKNKDDEAPQDIGRFIQLGPLGTALIPNKDSPKKPRMLLIDEIDKSDIDLPNDLLNVFEDGEFDIPELVRIKEETKEGVTVATYYRKQAEERSYLVKEGQVKAQTFPVVIMTSNGEREFPPAFLRRCLRLEIPNPQEEALKRIVQQHLKNESTEFQQEMNELIREFLELQTTEERNLATDQLLNAIYLMTQSRKPTEEERKILINRLFQSLGSI